MVGLSRKRIVGVMGPGAGATAVDFENAYELGRQIALAGWVLLSGGRGVGVMDAASRGARAAGGLTVGILPNSEAVGMSEAVEIAIFTDMGSARNNINVLSCDVAIACGMGLGTTSEVALALKANNPTILLGWSEVGRVFFQTFASSHLWVVESVEDAIATTKAILND